MLTYAAKPCRRTRAQTATCRHAGVVQTMPASCTTSTASWSPILPFWFLLSHTCPYKLLERELASLLQAGAAGAQVHTLFFSPGFFRRTCRMYVCLCNEKQLESCRGGGCAGAHGLRVWRTLLRVHQGPGDECVAQVQRRYCDRGVLSLLALLVQKYVY